MVEAGQTGIWEIIFIALAVVWLLNALRKRSILKKMEEEMDRASYERRSQTVDRSTTNARRDKGSTLTEDAEYVDYEIIE